MERKEGRKKSYWKWVTGPAAGVPKLLGAALFESSRMLMKDGVLAVAVDIQVRCVFC